MADIKSMIADAAGRYGINPDLLVRQFTVESGLRPDAVSPKGALGIAQVMPNTAREMGYDPATLGDPSVSIDAGAKYMQRMYKQVQKMNPSLSGDALDRAVLAAYNAGAGGAKGYIMTGDESKLPSETQGYIQKIKGAAQKGVKPSVFEAYFSGRMDQADADKFKELIDSGVVDVPAKYQKKQEPYKQSVIAAYQSGAMSPEDRVRFEDSITSNPSLLPKGVTIGSLRNAPNNQQRGILDELGRQAQLTGRAAIEGIADVGGIVYDPIAATINAVTPDSAGYIPSLSARGEQLADTLGLAKPESDTEKLVQQASKAIVGAGGTIGAGKSIAGAAPMAAEFLAAQPVAQAVASAGAAGGAEATRQAGGGEAAQLAAGLVGGLSPAVGMAAGQGAAKLAGTATGQEIARAAEKAAAPVKSAVSSVLEKSAAMGGKGKKATANVMDWIAPKAPTAPARAGSVGAAATPEELQRVARARELGFEGETALTEGQITRNPAQQSFESDLSKIDEGESINQRYTAQNQQIINTLDNFIDATGKQAPTKLEGGRQVVDVLGSVAENRKNQIRAAYKAAENSDEANSLIQLDDLVRHINESAPEALNAKSLNVTRAKMMQLGAAIEDEAGNLIAQPVKLKDAERLRTAIGNAAGNDASDIRQVTIMKGIFDDATEGAGGALYKKARGLRRQFAKDFENRGVVSNLINTKRGSDDRIVAMENVLDKTMFAGSLDDVRHMRKVLQTAGEDGRQAWRELQGATLEKIKEASLTNAKDSMGNNVVSPAAFAKQVKALDDAGKLDFVFGKKGAAQIRDLSDLIQDVKVFVSGSVNMSNNRNAIVAGFMDAGVNMMLTGVPMPAVTMAKAAIKAARNRETAKRVRESLKYSERF